MGLYGAPFFMELKVIPGVIGYSASSCGQIISSHRLQPFALKQGRHTMGYRSVNLKVENGYRTFLVHRLVMAAWVGPCPKGLVINHINGDKTDNRLENLEYCTRSQNMQHSYRTGLSPKPPTQYGVRAPKAKLTDELVLALRRETDREVNYTERLAQKYGVTAATVSKALLGKTWRHLPLNP